ncbi:MAG: hypothetical protein LBC96_03505 [Lachnospiraceae bacterium]|jgi:hypothetical protein|nr:hypothetical protein [Lachnospiraceae bacterium]
MDGQRFLEARARVTNILHKREGIGTMQEKTLHAVLKYYYAPCEETHEIPIGSYIADIFDGRMITEIQTAKLFNLRAKLSSYLPSYPVTVVYPLVRTKWLGWIDTETGASSKLRKSTRQGTVYHAFAELYWIKSFLTDDNIRFSFPIVDVEEYRLLDGYSRDKKRGSHRYDRIPICLADEVHIECVEDYLQFIPYDLAEPFTVKELAKRVKINHRSAGYVLNVLCHLGTIKRVANRGKEYCYIVA